MKKIVALLLIATFALFAFSACRETPVEQNNDTTPRIALDLTEEWNKISDTELVQGCIVVRRAFAEEHPEAVAKFLENYEASINYITDAKNAESAAQMIVSAKILPNASIAKSALPRCNIEFKKGLEMKNTLSAFLSVLHDYDPKAVGGSMPADNFYYEAPVNITPADDAKIRIAVLSGPTGIGMAKLINDNTEDSNYEITLYSDPTSVLPLLIKNEIDVAALPTNAAATVYNKTKGNVEVLATNTLGVLYLLERGNTIDSVADLRGKTVSMSGVGSTPEYILRYILEENGLTPGKDVTIEGVADHDTLVTQYLQNESRIAVLPEPKVTVAMTKAANAASGK